ESDRHAKLRIGLPKRVGYRGLREQLVLEKKLVPCDSPAFYVFAENIAFSSPTAGAVMVNAGNVSGRIGSWRVEGTSKTYQDWYEEKLARRPLKFERKELRLIRVHSSRCIQEHWIVFVPACSRLTDKSTLSNPQGSPSDLMHLLGLDPYRFGYEYQVLINRLIVPTDDGRILTRLVV
ncbi:MAG: DUF4357 domain-containing protein, partial [Pirellula sp.]